MDFDYPLPQGYWVWLYCIGLSMTRAVEMEGDLSLNYYSSGSAVPPHVKFEIENKTETNSTNIINWTTGQFLIIEAASIWRECRVGSCYGRHSQ